MKKIYSLIAMLFMTAIAFAQQPIMTIIVDGDCSGGNPKLLEIYAQGTVDFTQFTLQNQTNANAGDFGADFSLAEFGTVTDGFVYVTTDGSMDAIASDFPSLENASILTTGAMNVNGDDRLRIIDADGNVVDQYGVSDVDGSGESWEYKDSYATRLSGTGPDGAFAESNWNIAGEGSLDGLGICQENTESFESIIGGVGQYSSQASDEPTLNVNGSPITGLDYFENNGPSNEGDFTVSGMNLTGDVTVTAATFEVSLTSGAGFSSSVDIVYPGNGPLPSTTIYVRLPEGLAAGDYSESISVSSPGAPTQQVSVSGTVTADDPQIALSGFVDDLQYNEGSGPSMADDFTVSGRFLDGNGISVTVGAPFEIAATEDGTYSQSINLAADENGTVDFVDVFVRLSSGQSLGVYSDMITITAGGAQDQTQDISGSVLAAANCAAAGSIIISEIMQNPSAVSDGAGEYFELYNTTDQDIDIQSWVIRDDASDNEMHTIATSLIVPANGYVVLAISGTDNGGINEDYVYEGISLGNGTDGLIIQCGGTDIDTVIWDNGATFPDPTGASMELSSTALNATANDDGSNWAEATTPYGDGDLGTPGAANAFTLSNSSINKTSFSLYPNPSTTGLLHIEANNGASFDVQIYSTLGQEVLAKKSVTRTIDISNLNTGVYIVKVVQGESSQTRKLLVK